MNNLVALNFPEIKKSLRSYASKIICENDYLDIFIEFHGNSVRFSFQSIVAYKKVEESFGLEMMSWPGDPSEGNQCVYRVEDSEFAAWAKRADPAMAAGVQHYEFFTGTDFIGVLSPSPPVASAVDTEELEVRAPRVRVFPDGEPVQAATMLSAAQQFRPERPTDIFSPVSLREWNAAPLAIESSGGGGWSYFANVRLGAKRYSLRTDGRFFRYRKGVVGPDIAGRLPTSHQRHAFYQVENSSLVEWVRWQSAGLLDDHRLAHFVCIGENGVIDIVEDQFPALVPL